MKGSTGIFVRLALVAALAGASSYSSAQVYKCKDAAGNTTFGQVPCGGVIDDADSQSKTRDVQESLVSSTAPNAPRVTYTAPEGSESKAVNALSAKLKDPGSLQIRNVVAKGVSPDPSKWALCGEYNAKNGFGGYVGFQRFAVIGDKAYSSGDEIQNIMVVALCGE